MNYNFVWVKEADWHNSCYYKDVKRKVLIISLIDKGFSVKN